MSAHCIYLHGFGSSPASIKAGMLGEHLAGRVASYAVPDLEPGSFAELTMDSRRERGRAAILDLPADGLPLLLIGSSLGAYQAVRLVGAGLDRPAALLLIAPAFGFVERWAGELGPEGVAAWEERGSRTFYRFRTDREEELGAAFLHSCQVLPAVPRPSGRPVVVVHGRRDQTVAEDHILRYAATDPACELHLLDGDHALEEKRHLACIRWCARDLLTRLEGGDAG